VARARQHGGLLYTDGFAEAPGRDIDVGVGRLLGEADRLVTIGFQPGARTRACDEDWAR
jgi:hypothetical protein